MTVTKISVSVDSEVAELVKAAAERDDVSVSAWLADAAKAKIRNEYLKLAVDESVAEHNLDVSRFADVVDDMRRSAIQTSDGG